ncbi:Methyltransferase domain-containing protein [Parafrankia irregularis]|uniref:Methyltransferase domain-containing protein n=1 Tax=Parafrankia irregularis TaxID=795642 RepID=A0A0S4QU10_9ACTN|nr:MULTISPECIES: class I SAM-dependent methyltransferase [Parafrankia]MBE3203671.1 class I SAM-dependent methyltransferase [Parafrankia sp. CH37]CUU59088.1 Methyltransferase domain-containing protein [Parafrankia irregularis]
MKDSRRERFGGLTMEGPIARWYTRLRGTGPQREAYRKQAAALTEGLADGAAVLELAPGPGFLAIEIARLGRCPVSALDISRTFVGIVTEQAAAAGVRVDVRHGDAAEIPFPADSFDLVVCQAAFKNFTRPGKALDEIHRVLRPDGTAVIEDMNHLATATDINREVASMRLNRISGAMTRRTLRGLRRRAYTPDRFEELATASVFGGATIRAEGISLEVVLRKADASRSLPA